jgi:carbonic anhydrase
MRLLEAIIDANNRAVAGDQDAGLHPSEFGEELPIVALTCIDPRLNPLFPQVLGVLPEQFIWLRNAGNIITGPTSSTMRSLALACAVKGGKEIVIIGHTDCLVGKTTTMQLLERLRAIGVERHALPDNINEFFGIFSSERQNVIKATDIARHSPLLGPKIPIHGLMVDVQTGKLEWIVNGYQALDTISTRWNEVVQSAGQTMDALKSLTDFNIGEMKFPETKIGEVVTKTEDWLSSQVKKLEIKKPVPVPEALAAAPPKIPLPLPIRPRVILRKGSAK